MNKVRMIVYFKGMRELYVNDKLVSIHQSANYKDKDLFDLIIKTLWCTGDVVQTKPILYVQKYIRKWPSITEVNMWKPYMWIMLYNNRKMIAREYLSNPSELSDILVMDRAFNEYCKWVKDNEFEKMAELL